MPGAPRPQAAPRPPSPAHRPCEWHLQGSTAPAPARSPGGPWLFRTRESGRCATQHRPENGRRRLGSAGPARPRRGVEDAAGLGRGRPDPQPAGPGARGTAARRTRPREGGGGTGGGGRTTAARGPDRTWCDGGVGAGVGTYDGPAGAPDSTRGAVACASFPRENTARNLAQGQPSLGGQRPLSPSEQGLGRQKGPWVPDPDLKRASKPCTFQRGRIRRQSSAVLM